MLKRHDNHVGEIMARYGWTDDLVAAKALPEQTERTVSRARLRLSATRTDVARAIVRAFNLLAAEAGLDETFDLERVFGDTGPGDLPALAGAEPEGAAA